MGTILFADGSLEARSQAMLALEGTGCTLVPAANGREALLILARQRPDMVVAEVELPGIDGIALAWHIRSWFPDVPIVLMSAAILDADLRLLRPLYDAFLPKPVCPEQIVRLAARLSDATGDRGPVPAALGAGAN